MQTRETESSVILEGSDTQSISRSSSKDEFTNTVSTPKTGAFRALPWLILLTVSLSGIGNFALEAYPQSLQTQFTRWFGGPSHYSTADNIQLISVVQYPNIILPLFLTLLIDKYIGLRLGIFLEVFGGFLGQCVFAIGIQFRNYPICVLGRFLWGVSDNTLSPSQSLVAQWFEGRHTFPLGVLQSVARGGTALSFFSLPLLANLGIPFALWSGCVTYLLCISSSVWLNVLDIYGREILNITGGNQKGNNELLLERKSTVTFADIKKIPIIVWFMICINATFYVSFTLFFSTGVVTLQKTGGKISAQTSSQLFSIPSFSSLVLYPLVGFLIDKFKINRIGLVVGTITWVGGLGLFLLYILNFVTSEIYMVAVLFVMGLGNVLYALCMYGSIPLVVNPNIMATVYALMSCLVSAATSISLIAVSYLEESKLNVYVVYVLIEMGFGTVAFLGGIFLFVKIPNYLPKTQIIR